MNTKSRARIIISAIITGLMMLFLIGTGIAGLAKSGSANPNAVKKGEVCEFAAFYAEEAYEIKNSVNFIPTGKEHFYVMVTEDDVVRYLVRAKPSWINKRFPDEGFAEYDDVVVKGLVCEFDYEIKQQIRKEGGELFTDGTLSGTYYIDMRYKEFAWLRILCGLAFGAVLVFGNLMSATLRGNKFLGAIFGIVSLGVAVLLLYTLSVGGMGF